MLRLTACALLLFLGIGTLATAAAVDTDTEIGYDVTGGRPTDELFISGQQHQPATDSSEPDTDPDTNVASPPGCDVVVPDERTCGYVGKPAPGEPAVTLTDLAVVRPTPPSLSGDPVGFGLMNAPSNIVATTETQTVATELFDRPVQVMFVPMLYTFDYGDGGSRTSDTGGATWESMGVPQFTPTATTHVYGARGTYTVTVTVAYAPFVDFGSGWRPVPGTLSATSGAYGIQIVEARTALVAHDCNEDPTGVGCPTV